MRGLRHFTMLLRRIGSQVPGEGPAEPGSPSDFALALTAAVRAARNPQEFEKNLGTLRELGWGVEPPEIFRALGLSLPGWIPPEARPKEGEAVRCPFQARIPAPNYCLAGAIISAKTTGKRRASASAPERKRVG